MIRPITVICWILALGAGLYLYRAKHEVELMDKHIDQIAKETNDLRAESRHLLDDWIRLGEPEQLHKYSDEYLGLKTIAPTQFARLSDLPTRLPAPRADPPAEQTEDVAQSSAVPPSGVEPATESTDSMDEADADELPVPPIPPTTTTLTAVSPPAVTAVPLQARPVTPRVASAQPEQKPLAGAEPRVADAPHAAVPKPQPGTLAEPRQNVPSQANGQFLGQTAPQAHWLPRSQSQGQAQGQGLPPLRQLQSQGLPPLQAQGPMPGQGPGQAFGQPAPRPAENRLADTRANDPARENRPMQPQFADPRGPGPQVTRQAAAPAPTPTGSLLGMSRGPVPLPLPAPTPVSATWTGSSGPGR